MDHAWDVASRVVACLQERGAKVSLYPGGSGDEVRLFVTNNDGTMARIVVTDHREITAEDKEIEDYPT